MSGAGRRTPVGSPRFPPLLAGLFFAFLGVSTALDKAAPRGGHRRTPENTLHLLALLGGWPGALVAQNRLRHKSSKTSFLAVFWITVLLNCVVLGLYLTPAGARALRAALGVA